MQCSIIKSEAHYTIKMNISSSNDTGSKEEKDINQTIFSKDEVKDMKEKFSFFDVDGGGGLTATELEKCKW